MKKQQQRGKQGRDRGNKTDNQDGKNGSTTTTTTTTTLLVQLNNEPWYEYGNSLSGRNATIVSHPPPPPSGKGRKGGGSGYHTNNRTTFISRELVERYRSQADALIRNQVQLYNSSKRSTADDRWVESTLHKGTLKDRVAAMSVLVSTDPIYKSYAFDSLLQMAGCFDDSSRGEKSTNSRVAQMAAEALEDLFLNTLLPRDRKLLTLTQRPLYLYEQDTTTQLSPRILILWRYEELVHQKFANFVEQYYHRTLRDGLELDKLFCLRSAATVLKTVPEGESMLLQLLVDKLGDPNKKVAAAAAHQLRDVLGKHPAMQTVIAREVMQLTHRPNLSHRALYNAVTFLNQLKLTKEEEGSEGDDAKASSSSNNNSKKAPSSSTSNSLAASLMSTYFRLFEVAVAANKRSPAVVDSSGNSGGKAKKTKNKRHNAKNSSNGSRSSNAEKEEQELIAMKSRLLSALLTGVNRAHPYLPRGHNHLLDQHVDALYRVVHTAAPATSTQALMLLFHAIVAVNESDDHSDDEEDGTRNLLPEPEEEKKRERFYRALYSTLSSSMLGSGKHLTMFFNLLYKAMKYDTESTRVLAFSKRVLSTSLHCSNTSTVVASSLFLLNEIGKYHPSIRKCGCEVLKGKDAVRILDYSKREPRGALTTIKTSSTTPSSNPSQNTTSNGVNSSILESASSNKAVPLWELALTNHHFHPSVVKFTEMFGDEIKYTGDPLRDFGLAPFLDKFAYRNPKSSERLAQQQTGSGGVADRRRKRNQAAAAASTPVNDPSFWEQQKEIEAQDEFFHKFFAEREKRDRLKGIVRTAKKKVDDDDDDDDEDVSDDAMDTAEAGYNADKKFEDFEHQWETDSEEEDFVNSLAEKIIEDSVHQNGPILDDEDPDMEGWSDMDDDDDSEESGSGDDAQGRDVEDAPSAEEEELVEQEDAFMDDDDSDEDGSDSEEENEEAALLLGEEKITSFAASDSGDDDDDDVDVDEEEESSDDDGENDLPFLDEDDDDSDDDFDQAEIRKNVKKKTKMEKKAVSASTFASLEEYEERINESFSKLKRPNPASQQQVEEAADGGEVMAGEETQRMTNKEPHSEKKARKKKTHQKNKKRRTTV